MNLLGASVLFNTGTNLHNQLRVVTSRTDSVKYRNLLRFLDKLYMKENTRKVRDELQQFIVTYRSEIYKEYSKTLELHGEDDFNYALKID